MITSSVRQRENDVAGNLGRGGGEEEEEKRGPLRNGRCGRSRKSAAYDLIYLSGHRAPRRIVPS